MDILSHALWGRGVFGYGGHKWLATFFGALPDLITFFPFMLVRILKGQALGRPPIEKVPHWTRLLYSFSHSLVIAFLFVIVFWRIDSALAFAMLAWPLHILVDFPFHTKAYFTVPIFWPISNFRFSGIHWSTPVVWFSNLALLIGLYLWRYLQSS
ncbi:MAG TPA: hypothetical protein PLT76_01470 [Candidatus Omnitrophota bacterium]|nr:hypothetical protein [Candidatus Omnitrophota bacterium]HQO57378.1 hypothetical protein [Candidatus Omnitrophota bacterium]